MKTAFKNLIFFMLFLNINTGVLNAEMKVSMSPPSGRAGMTFTNSGSGFTPNHTVTIMRRTPDGSVQAVARVRTNSSGSFSATWTAKTSGNNFAWWAMDDATGKRSENEVVYNILPPEPIPTPQPLTTQPPLAPTAPPVVGSSGQPPGPGQSFPIQSSSDKESGEEIGTWKNISAYSNGPNTGTTKGDINLQCLPYVQRFYSTHYFGVGRWGNARNFWKGADPKLLQRFMNDGKSIPQPDDIVYFDVGTDGHVAIVTKVSGSNVEVTEQNWNRNTAYRTVGLSKITGWLRPVSTSTQGDTQKLKVIADEIQGLRREMMDGKYKLPEYLPGTSGKIPGIIGGFGTKEYDKHWYEAKNYHDTAQQQLRQASDFVRSGNMEGAMNSLNQAKQCLQKFLVSVSASATTWDNQLAKAERIARVAQTAADLSLSTLAQLVPGATPLAQQFLLARNIYFDSKMHGVTEATKNAIVTIAIGKVFENSLPSGRPVKGLGDIDLSLLARRLKEDGGFRNRITQEVAKSLKGEVAQDIIQEITLKASNEFATYLESIAPPVKQIPTRSTGHIPPPTSGPARTLRVGADAIVSNTYENGRYIGLKLRNSAGLNAPKTGNLPEGTRVRINEGPVSKDGYTWWRVESPVGRGWCAGTWLVPAP